MDGWRNTFMGVHDDADLGLPQKARGPVSESKKSVFM